jgi:hypothetical protein
VCLLVLLPLSVPRTLRRFVIDVREVPEDLLCILSSSSLIFVFGNTSPLIVFVFLYAFYFLCSPLLEMFDDIRGI